MGHVSQVMLQTYSICSWSVQLHGETLLYNVVVKLFTCLICNWQ